ncbi:MAG TPA: IPT/TIG domain-containing protein [Bryobacteraceae bacterium]
MVSSSPNGNFYVADFTNNRIRLLTRVLPPPLVSAGGVVSASSFGEFPSAAPGSWIEIYGTNLAVDSRQWSGSDFTGVNAPTSLDGTSVSIGGKAAYVAFINSGQVNVQVPPTVTPGTQQLTVTIGGGTSAAYNLTINPTEPGLDAPPAFKIGGTQYVVAIAADGSYVIPTGSITGVNSKPAKPGDTIVLYGVGFGPVTPAIPPGQIVQQLNQLTGNLSISIGGVNAGVGYAGLAPNYVGLYQFNVVVPQVPSGNAVPVTFTLGGVAGSQTLYIAVQ